MKALFGTTGGLIITDGTSSGTAIFTLGGAWADGYQSISALGTLGGKVLIGGGAVGGAPGTPQDPQNQLWITDGTEAGSAQIATLPDYTPVGGWSASGTGGVTVTLAQPIAIAVAPPATVTQVADTSQPAAPLYYSAARIWTIVGLGDRAVFAYDDGSISDYTTSLWTTDGTAPGTRMLINADGPSLSANGSLPGGRLVFTDTAGLAVTDGTASGTFSLQPALGSLFGFAIGSIGSDVLIGAGPSPPWSNSPLGNQLWRTDGTPAGTVPVVTLPGRGAISAFTRFGDRALFDYTDTATGKASLWISDGTASGTVQLASDVQGTLGAMAGSRYVFVTQSGLEATDGSAAGTVLIKPSVTTPGGFGGAGSIVSIGDAVVFVAETSSGSGTFEYTTQLWYSDGTAAGTRLITTMPASYAPYPSWATIESLSSVGGEALFNYYDSSGNPAVWATDGTAAGTTILTDQTSTQFYVGSNGGLTLPQASVVAVPGGTGYSATGEDTVVAAGADTIDAAGHDVLVFGGAGRLTFAVGDGCSTVIGGTGGVSLTGGAGSVTVFGGGSDNVLAGGAAGDNLLVAGSGIDTLEGIGSGDRLWGNGRAGDLLFAGSGNETLGAGAAGAATLVGGDASVTFVGNGGQSTIFAGSGNDTVWTGAGHTVVVAGSGSAVVVFGRGDATVWGGAGTDLYTVINGTAGGTDVIQNFRPGTDRIMLDGYGANAARQQSANGSTTLTLTDGTRIILAGLGHLDPSAIG